MQATALESILTFIIYLEFHQAGVGDFVKGWCKKSMEVILFLLNGCWPLLLFILRYSGNCYREWNDYMKQIVWYMFQFPVLFHIYVFLQFLTICTLWHVNEIKMYTLKLFEHKKERRKPKIYNQNPTFHNCYS